MPDSRIQPRCSHRRAQFFAPPLSVPLVEVPIVHRGVDWIARIHAAWTNVVSLRAVRGASTITEQVVRMIHPRPRTLWSRWVEGFEAMRLETRFDKAEILKKGTEAIEGPVQRLAARLHARGWLSDLELQRIEEEPLRVTPSEFRIDAAHFVARVPDDGASSVVTTLDGSLQRRAQQLLVREMSEVRHWPSKVDDSYLHR